MSVEITSLDVRQNYGPREIEDKVPSRPRTAGATKELVLNFNYDDLPTTSEEDSLVLSIPANALVVSARAFVSESFDSTSGTTTVDVGLAEADGTPIDVDGLIAAVDADGVSAGWVVGSGALVGASVGAAAGQIVVSSSVDDLTAGSAEIVVEYVDI